MGSIWIYFLILGLLGLLCLAFNTTKLRQIVSSTFDQRLLSWLLKLTEASFWFDAVILLMAK